MAEYGWKAGYRPRVDAQVAGEAVEALCVRNAGRLTAGLVVDEARPDEHPLHPAFEWDDAVAAEEHRKDQARKLLHSLVVTVADSGRIESAPQRAFVHVSDGDSYYTTLAAVLDDREKYENVLASARREFEAFRAKYHTLVELRPIFDAADDALGATAAR